jgi:hypothetical protein
MQNRRTFIPRNISSGIFVRILFPGIVVAFPLTNCADDSKTEARQRPVAETPNEIKPASPLVLESTPRARKDDSDLENSQPSPNAIDVIKQIQQGKIIYILKLGRAADPTDVKAAIHFLREYRAGHPNAGRLADMALAKLGSGSERGAFVGLLSSGPIDDRKDACDAIAYIGGKWAVDTLFQELNKLLLMSEAGNDDGLRGYLTWNLSQIASNPPVSPFFKVES